MDEVVLVKGWKKSANWSFPRGKINKDENDLDCAVREVYEETGYDVRAAGLVKDEKDMKYIEVTMREQHMRLYVFRGVPSDAYFEPKTRKEISKIEWYKLMDLPTLKKNRQHEGSGTDRVSINANKFYMVAPFLNPLKKWIAQQRKKNNRYSSHLAAPPMVAEDPMTEEEQHMNGLGTKLAETAPQAVSDLPEVSVPALVDPTSHLKEMLNIGAPVVQPKAAVHPSHMPQVDTEKSNALLALLRGDSQTLAGPVPQTPFEQISMSPEFQQSPHVSHVRQAQIDQAKPPPPFQPPRQQSQQYGTQPVLQRPQEPAVSPQATTYSHHPAPQVAPYQRTGDPLSRPQGALQQRQGAVPPASALPKLTNHTKALLDVFKGATGMASLPSPPARAPELDGLIGPNNLQRPEMQSQSPPGGIRQASQPLQAAGRGLDSSTVNTRLPAASNSGLESQSLSLMSSRRPQSAQRTSLLELFNQPLTPKATPFATQPSAPVELAATTAHTLTQKPQVSEEDPLFALLRPGIQAASQKPTVAKQPSPREGETSATIKGPLNQPEFAIVSRTTRHGTNEMGRSPLTTSRTLYDPNAPPPMKILTRPEELRPQPPRSPRGIKSTSKRAAKEKPTTKEQVKPFQPQILRRPQTAESSATTSGPQLQSEAVNPQTTSTAAAAAVSPSIPAVDATEKAVPSRKPSQNEAQKQTLLSLFGGGLDTTPRATPLQPSPPRIVSPLTASQLISTNGEVPLSGIDPISTRTSRVGSMASVVSGPGTGRVGGEKRQTGADNKAFLLGYLGRIANQEK